MRQLATEIHLSRKAPVTIPPEILFSNHRKVIVNKEILLRISNKASNNDNNQLVLNHIIQWMSRLLKRNTK